MKKLIVFVMFIHFSVVFCQKNTITGFVLDLEKKPVANILVTIYDSEKNIITYKYTNNQGHFSFDLNKKYNSIFIKISSLFYNEFETKVNPFERKELYFEVVEKIESLDEVVITSSKYNRDTVNLKIKKYNLNKNESVENSLKKIPGISVDKNGRIKYFNKEIEKILIDGDDLASDQYTFISKNLRTEVIEDIQILKNFEENTVLKQIKKSEKIALNLKVKDKFKNIWFGNLSLGYGYGNKSNSMFDEALNLGLLKQKIKFLDFLKYSTLGTKASPSAFNEDNNDSFNNVSLYDVTKFDIDLPPEIKNFNKAFGNTLLINTKIKNFTLRNTNFIGIDRERQNYYKITNFFNNVDNSILEESAYNDKKILIFGDLELKNNSSKKSYFVNTTRYNFQFNKFSSSNSINNNITSDLSKTNNFSIQNAIQFTSKVSNKIFLDNKLDFGYSNSNENTLINAEVLASNTVNQLIKKKQLYLNATTEFSYLLTKNIKCNFLLGNKFNKEDYQITLSLLNANNNDVTFKRNSFIIHPSLIYRVSRNIKIKSSIQSIFFKFNNLEKTLLNFDTLLSLKFWANIDLYYAKKQNFPSNQNYIEDYYLINNFTFKRGSFFNQPINYDYYYLKINKKNRKNTFNNEVFLSYKKAKSSLLETYEFIDGLNYANTSLTSRGEEYSFKNQLILLVNSLGFKLETRHNYSLLPLNNTSTELNKLYSGSYILGINTYFLKKLNFNANFEYNKFTQDYQNTKTTFDTKKATLELDYNINTNVLFNLKGSVYELNKQYYKIFNASIDYNPKNKKISYGLGLNNIFNENSFSFQNRNSFYQTNTEISLVPFYAFANIKYIF